jgi:hypothetical protein
MRAELVRITTLQVDIKIVKGDEMHVLQWRRRLLGDEVLLDGKRQALSNRFWNREKVYGLVFGRDNTGEGGTRVMLLIDPSNEDHWFGTSRKLAGVRLETVEGPLVAYGTLDPQTLEKPSTFGDWMKKNIGMDWGDVTGRSPTNRPH